MVTPNQIKLDTLQKEQKQLEDEIRQRRARISDIRAILTGSKDVTGLAALVEMEHRQQEWIDGEPERAAMRATPEWQAWRKQLFAERNKS